LQYSLYDYCVVFIWILFFLLNIVEVKNYNPIVNIILIGPNRGWYSFL